MPTQEHVYLGATLVMEFRVGKAPAYDMGKVGHVPAGPENVSVTMDVSPSGDVQVVSVKTSGRYTTPESSPWGVTSAPGQWPGQTAKIADAPEYVQDAVEQALNLIKNERRCI